MHCMSIGREEDKKILKVLYRHQTQLESSLIKCTYHNIRLQLLRLSQSNRTMTSKRDVLLVISLLTRDVTRPLN